MQGARSFALRVCVIAVGLALLSACDVFDASVLERFGTSIERPPRDAGAGDAGEPPCTAAPELCNGRDDDCDGKVDEDADSACAEPNASVVCASGGRCVRVSCAAGYADCNGLRGDGCEHREADGPCPSPCDQEFCEPMDGGQDGQVPEPEDAQVDDAADDAGDDAASDACVAQAEVCDGVDNDCDDAIDETPECALERCIEATPSYRGQACDRCVCEKCADLTDHCQDHADATWRARCRAVLECFVVEGRAGNCGASGVDCYRAGNGPCAGPINLAAGGTSETDTGPAFAGQCAATDPPTTACMAATRYRDVCTLDRCQSECAN